MELLIGMKRYNSIESLGFSDESPYQAELIFNRYLPYAEQLDDEADNLLAEIKTKLGRCVLMGDIDPGCVYWSTILMQYISLYSLRFTKDEHVALVKLFYELITITDLPIPALEIFAATLMTLLKKKCLISQEDLKLPWKPLYKICKKIVHQNSKVFVQNLYPPAMEDTLDKVVQKARRYFPVTATQEILDELRPKIYPFDSKTMSETFRLFEMFLPVQVPVEYHSIGHQLWLHEFMKIWENSKSLSHWETYLMSMIAKLAKWNVGYIDWNPYIPIMFTRFIRNLKLPVYYQNSAKNEKQSGSSLAHFIIAKWIVSVLGDNYCAQPYFEKFLKTIESYFQSANQGSWTNKLNELFYYLVLNFAKRLSRERYKRESWTVPTPENYKLTDANVDTFVNSMMPIAMVTIFNYNISALIRNALQLLALMRPNIVIPKLMGKLDISSDMSVESHKFLTFADSMFAISKPLVLGSEYHDKEHAFSEGRFLVVPLLLSTLSGIDPNEPSKCYKAIDLIWLLSNLVPLHDCSRSEADMSPDDRILCENTSCFKEFLMRFMDKIFIVINSNSSNFDRLDGGSKENSGMIEMLIEHYIENTFESLLLQANESLFIATLDKFSNFIMENDFEVNVAGKLVATICGVFAIINGELTVKTLFPYLSQKILNAIGENDEILKEENLSINLLYPLNLLESLILNCHGNHLMPYINTIVDLLDKATLLEDNEGNDVACGTLGNLLETLTNPQISKLDKNLNDSKYPYWKDWGKSVDFDSAKIKWYVPGEAEMIAAEQVFQHFFIPTVSSIQNYIKGKISLSRNELQRKLKIISNIIKGLETALPPESEPPIVLADCDNCVFNFKPTIGIDREIKMPDGSNVRRFTIEILEALQTKILRNEEDDTKSLNLVIQLWGFLSLDQTENFDDLSYFGLTRFKPKGLDDKIIRDKGYVPRVFLHRVGMQHHLRRTHTISNINNSIKKIVKNLFNLCISKYAIVRSQAQEVLWSILNNYKNSHQLILDDILEVLDYDPETNHEAFKGVLYTINEDPNDAFFRCDWKVLSKLLPALVLSKSSEKPTIIEEFQNISVALDEAYHSINFDLRLSENCLIAASNLWSTSGASLVLPHPTQDEINLGANSLQDFNKKNLQAYNNIFDKLITAITEKKLNSRHQTMAMQFINTLMHPNYPLPSSGVTYFLETLNHYSLRDRKLGWKVISKCMKQNKLKFTKKIINIPNREISIKPGRRIDNEWLQYNPKKFPTSVAEWEESRYMHDHWVGYYMWPKEVKIYNSTLLQPNVDKNARTLNDQEKSIDLFFSNKEKISKFIEFLALEDKKTNKNRKTGEFNFNRYLIFKGLFKNFGDSYLSNVLPHLSNLVKSKHEASHQRLAAEIICGIVCGSKHWSYPATVNMWKKLLPIIKEALDNIMEETILEWKTCFEMIQLRRDPSKIYWLIEFLMEEIQKVQSTSRIECVKLSILESVIKNQVWRLGDVLKRLQSIIETRLLDNPFDSVRDSLASALVAVYNANLNLLDIQEDETKKESDYPRIEDFIQKIYPRLEILLEENDIESESYVRTTRLLNTMCAFIKYTDYSHIGLVPCFYSLYKIINQMETNEADKELAQECTQTLAVLARFWTSPKYVPGILKTIDNVSQSPSWLSRLRNTEFLQVWLFHNMSTILSNEIYIGKISSIILSLLEDKRVEVREAAAKVLTGMLHCSILPNEEFLLERFKEMAKKKLRAKGSISDNLEHSNALRIRHTAVLGMCAFIKAHPYDLPDNIPPIFQHLNKHLNDPAPIPATIRDTLNDFKRTHCDSWTGLEGLANIMTQEQYTFLQDLTVAPSYYA